MTKEEYKRNWYQRNRERIILKSCAYQKTEKGKEVRRKIYQKQVSTTEGREEHRQLGLKSYYRNLDVNRAKSCAHTARRRVKVNRDPESDYLEFTILSRKLDARCAYCGEWLFIAGATVDHILPVSRGGSNKRENLCLCCKPCNFSKNNKTVEEWRRV